MREAKHSVLIGHSFWGRGGAEVAAMRLIEALCGIYTIDIITRGGFNLEELNRCSGTNVVQSNLGSVYYPPLTPKTNGVGGALWHGWFLRYCRSVAPRYELCITASRALDWGVPALHFLSDVTWNQCLQKRFSSPEIDRRGIIRTIYFKVASLLAGGSPSALGTKGTFVANSYWTAGVSAEFCGNFPIVIYPAVSVSNIQAAWSERTDEFLCLGRISPEKQVERVIAILDLVRSMGHPVRLHVAGGGNGGLYEQKIQRLCKQRSYWVECHGAVYGKEKNALLSRCRYGVSGCEIEAFGIATAEMTGAGLLPFVPSAGAQKEIVRESDLIYENIEDAAFKIVAVLKSAKQQRYLHEKMIEYSKDFLPDKFQNEVRVLISRMVADQASRDE